MYAGTAAYDRCLDADDSPSSSSSSQGSGDDCVDCSTSSQPRDAFSEPSRTNGDRWLEALGIIAGPAAMFGSVWLQTGAMKAGYESYRDMYMAVKMHVPQGLIISLNITMIEKALPMDPQLGLQAAGMYNASPLSSYAGFGGMFGTGFGGLGGNPFLSAGFSLGLLMEWVVLVCPGCTLAWAVYMVVLEYQVWVDLEWEWAVLEQV